MHAMLERPDLPAGTMMFQAPAFEPAHYIVGCIPARNSSGQVQNWTLKQLGDERFHARLCAVLPPEEPGTQRTYYAPTVNGMSGVVLEPKVFTNIYELDTSLRISRPGKHKGARVLCDGTSVGPHDGFLMAAGGCPLIILNGYGNDSEVCLAAHAGRDCLIDRHLVRTGKQSRYHFSVVEAMVAYARKHFGAKPQHLILRSFFCLPWAKFPHDPRDPVHGPFNRQLYSLLKERRLESAFVELERQLCLSLSALIRLQAERCDVASIDPGLFILPGQGDFAYTRHPVPELRGDMRNLVFLRRY